jgi:hypothetical protein
MPTISRAQWGAKATPAADPLSAVEVVGIAVHWPAMAKSLRGVPAVSAALRSWQAYHLSKGWRDIAYQVAVDQDGNRYILRGLDGVSAANGDTDTNRRYGAVLVVLAPGEAPTPAMLDELRRVVADHRRLFPKSTRVVGHKDIRPEPTACPGPVMESIINSGLLEPVDPKREERLAKLAVARKRRDKWRRWVKRANRNIARLKGLTK